MLHEISEFALPLALASAGLLIALLLTWLGARTPVPGAVLLLLAGALASLAVPSLREHVSILTVERIAVVALIVILLSGGIDIGAERLRGSLREVTLLGVLGTFVTAALIAAAAHLLLGVDWQVAGVIGAALAPTDPAVVFSVLGRREIEGRAGTVLEGEAGVNDPAGIALLLGMVHVATHSDASLWSVVWEFVAEMAIGAAFGVAGGLVLRRLLGRVRLPSGGEHAVLVIVSAIALYSVTALLHGSGFLAVFVAGLLLSGVAVPHHGDIERFLGGLASLAELVVFLVLGLTIDLAAIPGSDWLGGVAIAAVMMLIVRPLVAGALLWRSNLSAAERRFIAVAGLKGAVPVLLGAFAVLADAPEADRVYHLVFVVVLVSVAVQGSALALLADRIGVAMRLAPSRPWELNLRLPHPPAEVAELVVEVGAPAAGRALATLELPLGSWPTVVLRGDDPVAAHPDLVLEPGDTLRVAMVGDFEVITSLVRRPEA